MNVLGFIYSDYFLYFCIFLLILFVVFVLVREIMLWYWRINDFYEKMEGMEKHLGSIAENLSKSFTTKGDSVKDVIEQLKKEQPY